MIVYLQGSQYVSDSGKGTKRGILDTAHGEDVRLVHQVAETARSGDEDIAALTEIIECHAHGHATIHDAWAQHGPVAHATGLIPRLHRKLARRHDDNDEWLGPDLLETRRLGSAELLGLAHQTRHDRNHVAGGLAGAWIKRQ